MNEFELYVDSVHYKKFDRNKLSKLLSQYLIELSVRRESAKEDRDRFRLNKRVQIVCDLVKVLNDEIDYLK
jgi:hypothetical protein